MALSDERLEAEADVKATPQDKGLTYTIRVTAYDNGIIQVDGTPMNEPNDPVTGWLGAAVVTAQKVEHLRRRMKARARQQR